MCGIFSWANGWVSEIANGPIVLCWPKNGRTLAGIPAATERARVACSLCICAVCFVNREAAARSILTRSLVL